MEPIRSLIAWTAEASRGRCAALVGGSGLLLLLVADVLVRDVPEPKGDDLIYENMAREPFTEHTFPFAYRIAIPWLVHVLPFDTTFSFSLLAWLASAGTCAALFLLMEELRISRRISIPLAISVAVAPAFMIVSIRQGRNPDPMSVLVLTLGALFIVQRRLVPLALTMLIGAFNRESALFLAPWAYVVWASRPVDPAALRRMIAVALPAAIAYLSLRISIPTVGREFVPGYGGGLIEGRIEVLEEAWERRVEIVRRMGTAFGPFWLLLPLAIREWPWARRSLLVLAVLCGISMTFALDWGRIAFLAAPAALTGAAWVLDRRPRLVGPTFAAWALLIVVYAVYMHVHGVQAGIIDQPPPRYPVV